MDTQKIMRIKQTYATFKPWSAKLALNGLKVGILKGIQQLNVDFILKSVQFLIFSLQQFSTCLLQALKSIFNYLDLYLEVWCFFLNSMNF